MKSFPDKRHGSNCHFTLEDIGLGGFSVFFTQSPSFLFFQTAMKKGQGSSNCQTLFQMTEIPSDNHIRDVLDHVPASSLFPVFDNIFDLLNKANILNSFRSFQIENENNNTLKKQGYHLEHNFGHGKQHLSETLACMNIMAFLFHTILDLIDVRYCLIRKTLPRRDRFFADISALATYFCFDGWVHLMKTMLKGLKLEDPG